MNSLPPLAFVYDRHASPTPGVLTLRLDLCRLRANEQGWEVAGEWVDRGDAALSDGHRPEFDRMLAAMREASRSGRTVLCLVADWYRLSRDTATERGFRARIATAGGYTATGAGEDDQPGSGRGRPSMLGRL
jgi:DNA invertase Pin-like site-specific DNA recombinase